MDLENFAASTTEFLGYIMDYYRKRQMILPTEAQALMFCATELGEAFELLLQKEANWVRNNPQNKKRYNPERFGEECGDIVMMALVAGMQAGVNPLLLLFGKMERKTE